MQNSKLNQKIRKKKKGIASPAFSRLAMTPTMNKKQICFYQ